MITVAALTRRLEKLGARAVPALGQDQIDRLDDRIAVVTGTRVVPSNGERRSPGVVVPFPQRRRRARPIAAAVAAAVAAVVAAAMLAGSPTAWNESGPDRDLALASARNATVHLPDGSSVPAHVGLSLPEGAIVTTGLGGYVAAGGVELGPGVEAVVSGGELEPAATLPSVSAPPPPTAPPLTVPPIPATLAGAPLP